MTLSEELMGAAQGFRRGLLLMVRLGNIDDGLRTVDSGNDS
jgi:hypothetical protein